VSAADTGDPSIEFRLGHGPFIWYANSLVQELPDARFLVKNGLLATAALMLRACALN
jgi:hypothetical protein